MKKTTVILLALSLSFLGGCKYLQNWFGEKTEVASTKEETTPTQEALPTEEMAPTEEVVQTEEVTQTETITPEEIAPKSSVIEISTQDEFENEVLKSDKPAVLYFAAEWCGTCKTFRPVYEKVANNFKDKIKFVEANIDKLDSIAKEHEVYGAPAFLFFKDGNVIEKTEGIMQEDAFTEKLNAIYELQK